MMNLWTELVRALAIEWLGRFQRMAQSPKWRLRLLTLLVALGLLSVLLMLARPVAAASALGPMPPPAAAKYRRALQLAAYGTWGLGAPVPVFAAQVHAESAWNPQAVSRVGARGLAQFMPSTARWWCDLLGLAPAQCRPHNPIWALRALVGYDKFLHDRVSARYEPYDRMWITLRHYNGGAANWQAEARATGQAAPTRRQVDDACGRARRARVHCAENLAYPDRILRVLQPHYASWGPLLEATP